MPEQVQSLKSVKTVQRYIDFKLAVAGLCQEIVCAKNQLKLYSLTV